VSHSQEQGGSFAEARPPDSRLGSFVLAACLLLVAAAGVRWGLAPLLTGLPSDYASATHYLAQSRLRDSPTGAFTEYTLIAQRVDRTIVSVGSTNLLQGDLHWFTDSGQVLFENSGLYGVDRGTLANVPGYGDDVRYGQYLFPPDTQRITYTYWDPMFIGPRLAVFDRVENVDGMQVFVFRFSVTGLDETAGYSYLRDVPEHYAALTDGQGTLWVEPVSGVVMDYEESGVSYFADPRSGVRVASLFEWSDRFTAETRAAQRALVVDARWRLLALTVWLPAGLVCASLVFLGWGVRAGRRAQGRAAGGVGRSEPA
jgi:hypothetical protein